MYTVGILLSTYNGQKYIREQLDSIFQQTGVNIRLFVRDDGSTDNTIDILTEYAKQYSVAILSDGENLGPGNSFMKLLYTYYGEPGIDYFAFADQDDIWLADKMSIAIQKIEQSGYDGPVLYSSNQYIYTDGVNKGKRYDELQSTALIPHMTKNTISGCTFVFNKELAKLIAESEHANETIIKYRLHDAWVMLVAIGCGEAFYDETSHMLYRIHNDNTVGVKSVPVKIRIGRLQRFFKKRDDANIRMYTAQQLLSSFSEYIRDEDKEILETYAFYQKSWKNKMKLAFNPQIKRECLENPFVFSLKVLFNFV